MESSTETKKQSQNKVIIILILLIAVIVAVAAAAIFMLSREDDSPTIGYAAEATVMLDEASLQAAMDEAMRNAQGGGVALSYKNNAYSTDGTNFECYIANSSGNLYDMFLTIYADVEMTDQIFLSGLVPPGSGFENITLDHALETGDHTVYVAVTQVETAEDGSQQIVKQVIHTMDFHVVE